MLNHHTIVTMNKSIISFLFLIIWVLPYAVATPAAATIYYVDHARPDDSGAGTSWATAEKTILAGLAHLTSGDTLKIKSGMYTGEYIFLDGPSFTSWTTIETDDGNGNPGYVVMDGRVQVTVFGETAYHIVSTHNANYLKIDGRQPDGFTFNVSSDPQAHHYGITIWNGSSTGHHAAILYCTVTGTFEGPPQYNGPLGDHTAIEIYGYDDIEIAYNKTNVYGGAYFQIQAECAGLSDPNACVRGSVHHNDIQGITATGYSAISLKRIDQVDVYDNYIHNIITPGDGSALINVRDSHDNKIYNNVLWVESGLRARTFMDLRGFWGSQGGASRNWYYNNTFILDGTLITGVLHISDPETDSNKVFNNLLIGSTTKPYVETTTSSSGQANNELFNNVVTGTITSWFQDSSVAGAFSVNTGNVSGQGTSFIAFAGAKPSPYWHLSASKDGAVVSTLTADYEGNARSSPPDVGAFEYNPGNAVLVPNPPIITGIY